MESPRDSLASLGACAKMAGSFVVISHRRISQQTMTIGHYLASNQEHLDNTLSTVESRSVLWHRKLEKSQFVLGQSHVLAGGGEKPGVYLTPKPRYVSTRVHTETPRIDLD